MIPADLLDQLRETDEDLFLKVIGGFPPHTWLQHCLQEAIRARGWRLGFGVTWGYASAVISIDKGKSYIREEGTTEAEALLRAYLAAIQEAT